MKCGVVDVGSNTIRLSLYQWEDGTAKLLLNKKETAGLAGYIQNGALSEDGIQTACRALAGFRALLDNLEIPALYAFGTAPLRNISNTEAAVDAIEAASGIRLEVLSGAEEAGLAFRGAVLECGPISGLLTDIGGGSTELVSCRDGILEAGCSLPLGSLSLYTRQVAGLFPDKGERKAIRAAVERELERTAGPLSAQTLTGVGGTIRAAVRMCNARAQADPGRREIPAEEIRALYKRLKRGDKGALRQILRAAPDRVHTILPGLLILNAVLRACGAETVRVSASGVREGYLLTRAPGGPL